MKRLLTALLVWTLLPIFALAEMPTLDPAMTPLPTDPPQAEATEAGLDEAAAEGQGTAPAPLTPAPVPTRILTLNARGEDVKLLQKRLQQLGYFHERITGFYKRRTQQAVRAFQAQNGLAADGDASEATLALLFSDSALRFATPTPTPPPTPAPSPAPHVDISLTFGGDCVLGSEERARKNPLSFDSVIAEKGMDWPFSGLADIFSQDDMTQVNLECVLKAGARDLAPRKHNFRGLPQFAEILTRGSIEAVNVANNHFVDYGPQGRKETLKALQAAGVSYSGYGHFYVYQKGGVLVGIGGMRETIWHQDRKALAREIQQLKKMGCHYIVYHFHFGVEYEPLHTVLQTEMARAAIDAGANLVVGTHTHVVQGVETYHGGTILYGLGNLCFGGNLEMTEFDAVLAQVRLSFDHGRLTDEKLTLIPVITSGTKPANDFRPVVAEGADRERILQKIAADSVMDGTEQPAAGPEASPANTGGEEP